MMGILQLKNPGPFLDKLIGYLSGLTAAVAGAALLFMSLVIGIAAILRYVFNYCITSVDEYSGYMLVAITFLALAHTLRRGNHIRVNIITARLAGRTRNALEVVTSLLALYILAVMSRWAFHVFLESVRIHETASTLAETPMCYPLSLVWIGEFILGLAIVAYAVKKFRDFRKNRETND